MSISLGGIVITILVVAVFVIGSKVKKNSAKLQELQELDESTIKE